MSYPQEEVALRTHFELRQKSMEDERSSFLPLWDDIAQHVRPSSARIGVTIQPSKGWRKDRKIIDPTATLASRSLRSGLMAGLTSPARPWFKLSTADPGMMQQGGIKAWLYTVENTLRDIFIKSNFYQIIPMVYGDQGDFGTAAMSCLEDEATTVRFNHFLVGQYMIAVNQQNRTDSIYRCFPMTIRQIVQKFRIDNCSPTVKNMFTSQQYETEVEVCHVVEPNNDADKFKVTNDNKAFRSVYYESGADYGLFLRKSGFDEFPVMAPRWDLYDESSYGTACPGIDSLGTNRALQLSDKRETEAVDWWVRPHMLVDSTLQNKMSNMLPGGHTYADLTGKNPGARPLMQVNPDVDKIDIKIQRYQQFIKRCYFEDMMQMLAQSDNPEMTAREIEERHSEKVLILGPVMERDNDELFDPIIKRVYGIALRRGLIPPPPPEVQRHPEHFKIEYISILAQAQKLIGTASIEKVFQFSGAMAQIDPKVADKFNSDKAIDRYAEMHGIPPDIIRTDEEVKPLRDLRAKKEQAAQMMAAAKPLEQAAKAGKAMGDTDGENMQDIYKAMTGA